MALTVQNDEGTVDGANAYITVAEFKTYHTDRGADYSAYSDPQISTSIVRATDYLDTRFVFVGVTLLTTQTTAWPRRAGAGAPLSLTLDNGGFAPFLAVAVESTDPVTIIGPNGEALAGIPRALKSACAEYALRALATPLFQDAPAPTGGRLISKITNKVDVIEQSIEYADALPGAVVLPAYPIADLMLVRAGLVTSGRTLTR